LKPGWMKSWLCASAILALLATAAYCLPQNPKPGKRKNELSLYGIRPGKDTLSSVRKRVGEKWLRQESPREWNGHDDCAGQQLKIEIGDGDLVESVDVSPWITTVDCTGPSSSPSASKVWATGQGLRLQDKLERAIEIYGEPNSRGPSTRNGQDLELLYYAFDWAGSDVPQVMEVSCNKATGRVVEIMLAFPSL
jgi:hypothetical protein